MYLRKDGSAYFSMLSPKERGESAQNTYLGSYRQNEDAKVSAGQLVQRTLSCKVLDWIEIGLQFHKRTNSSELSWVLLPPVQ